MTNWVELVREPVYRDNSLVDFALAVTIIIVAYFGLRIVQSLLLRQLRRLLSEPRSSIFVSLLDRTWKSVLFLVAVWAGTKSLDLAPPLAAAIENIAIGGVFLQLAIWSNATISHFIRRTATVQRQENPASVSAFSAIEFFSKTALYTLILLLFLDNVGVDITALIAGLGVGSIAIALAVQNILGDIFCSVSILLDKPFEVGDFIIVDDKLGVVERIGIKSTRLRSLFGEQIVISNSDLLSSRIQNYRRMNERRVLFKIGVTYQTPHEKLERIPGLLKDVIVSIPNTRFDRAHFAAFDNFALSFEIVYYVLSPDYNVYMDTQQEINLEIHRRFEEDQIEFAYPTQTIFLEAGGSLARTMNFS